MVFCKHGRTLASPGTKLDNIEGDELDDPTKYRALGCL